MALHQPVDLGNGQRGSVSIVNGQLKLYLNDELEGQPGLSVVVEADKARDLAELMERTAGVLEDG